MRFKAVAPISLFTLTVSLCGCSVATRNHQVTSPVIPANVTGLHGLVHGGQQPVADSIIQIYAVGTTGDASAATPLLTHRVTTSDGSGNANNANANAGNGYNSFPAGSFQILDTNYCPSASSQVYLTSTQGNPGLSPASTNNASIALMAFLGSCGNLSASTNVIVNELTTVGSLAPLAPYMTSLTNFGYNASTDSAAFLAAAALVSDYTDTSAGVVPGPNLPANYYASSTEIDTLADVLATCINSDGGSGSTCGTLFSLATPTNGKQPTDTIAVAAQVINNPSLNIQTILGYALPSSPFQPILATLPATLTLPIVPTVATPVFSLASGTYGEGQNVFIYDSTSGATIYYTTDGTTPTINSNQYSGFLSLTGQTTLQAIAVANNYHNSNIASATYGINAAYMPTPEFSPAPGTYITAQTVYINYTGDTLYYTLDGTTPTASSMVYTGPITVGSTTTIKAIDSTGGTLDSYVGTATYTINNPGSLGVISTAVGNGFNSVNQNGQDTFADTGYPGIGTSVQADGTLTIDSSGNLYFGDGTYNIIRKTSSSGILANVAGNLSFVGTGSCPTGTADPSGGCGDGGQATSIDTLIVESGGIVTDTHGNIFLDEGTDIRKVNSSGVISLFAGGGSDQYDTGIAPTQAAIYSQSMTVDGAGNIYSAERSIIRKISADDSTTTIFAGANSSSSIPDGFPSTSGSINAAYMAFDSSGNLYFTSDGYIRKISGGVVTTVAGNGTQGYTGDGGLALQAEIYPQQLAVDHAGNIFFTDYQDDVVREVTASGYIRTVAGSSGNYNYGGDGGPSESSLLAGPNAIIIDSAGANLYIDDTGNNRIRKIALATTPGVQPPVFSITPGSYASSIQSVTLASPTTGAAIYYTTNGTLPTSSSTRYTSAISVSTYEDIIAVAIANNVSSPYSSAAYQVTLPPAFSVASGNYSSAQSVRITSNQPGATIYYTTDGSSPYTYSGKVYTGPISISSATTLNAVVLFGQAFSNETSAAYTINHH